MPQALWSQVDQVLNRPLLGEDPILAAALQASHAAGLPAIAVAPNQGKMLQLMAQMVGARRILEVGTLAGYSAIWLARALPADGRLISLEIDPHHAEVARSNLAAAGLSDRAEVRVGPAIEALPKLAAEGAGPFDLVFIDADKASNADYFAWALKLARPGALIVVDNVVRRGEIAEAGSQDPNVAGIRKLLDLVGDEPRVSATAIQTVGEKGHDGFLMARVVG
jgi:predicted O-methyltransferase YrrM